MQTIAVNGGTIKLKTNNQERDLICYLDLPDSFKKEFDYIGEEDTVSPRFVKYKGWYWDVVDTMPAPDWAQRHGWHAGIELGFDSLLLIRFNLEDCESAVIGYAYAAD